MTNAATALGDDGMYIAFPTNDVLDVVTNRVDSNDRVMITGIGAGNDGSFEITQGIIELRNFLPSLPPATITVLGPDPAFGGSKSKVKIYEGADCGGGNAGSVYCSVYCTVDLLSSTPAQPYNVVEFLQR